jgi:hypothetical protein
VLSVLREIQIPLLAVLLLGGSAAKGRRALSARSGTAAMGPTALFSLHLRRPAAIAMCATELFLGMGLLVTAWPPFGGIAHGRADGTVAGTAAGGAGIAAMVIRALTALLFLTAVGALHELRERRPDTGCGCFGDLSHTPVSWRALARSALLSVAALATVTAPTAHWLASPVQAWLLLGVFAAELAVLAALSREVGAVLVRLGYSEPCELRRLPVSRTLTALHGSAQWRRYRSHLAALKPNDVWREGCWRYVVYPGFANGRAVDIVFAVYLQARRPPVRAAIVDASTDEALARLGTAIPAQRTAPEVPAPARNSANL